MVGVDGDMDEPIVIGPKFDHVIWLLVKSWAIGVFVAAVLLGIIFTMGIDMSLETSTALKVVVTFIMGTLFLALSATLFTLPLVVIAGILAYIFHDKILRNPWATTCVTPIVGFVLLEVTTHLFMRVTDTSILDTLLNSIFTYEGIAILIALMASTGFYSFKIRASM